MFYIMYTATCNLNTLYYHVTYVGICEVCLIICELNTLVLLLLLHVLYRYLLVSIFDTVTVQKEHISPR